MVYSKKQIVIIFMAITMIIFVEAAPRAEAEWDRHNNPCVNDDIKVEVCQRCAKQTKSPIVYPLCCNSEDNVYEWCNDYINYGRRL